MVLWEGAVRQVWPLPAPGRELQQEVDMVSGQDGTRSVIRRTTEVLLNSLKVLFTGSLYASSMFASFSHAADISGRVEQLGGTFEESTEWIQMTVKMRNTY